MPGVNIGRSDSLILLRILPDCRTWIWRRAQTKLTRSRELLIVKVLFKIRFGKQQPGLIDAKLIGDARMCDVPGIWSHRVRQLGNVPRRIGAQAEGVLRCGLVGERS